MRLIKLVLLFILSLSVISACSSDSDRDKDEYTDNGNNNGNNNGSSGSIGGISTGNNGNNAGNNIGNNTGDTTGDNTGDSSRDSSDDSSGYSSGDSLDDGSGDENNNGSSNDDSDGNNSGETNTDNDNDDNNNDDNNDNSDNEDNAENSASLSIGTTTLDYATGTTLHTAIYYALNPANENYSNTATYTVTSTSSTLNQNIYNSKAIADNIFYNSNDIYYDLNNFSKHNNMKSKIIDANKNIEEYARNNNITPIEKSTSAVLYSTIPTDNIVVGTKWKNIYVLDTNSSSTRYNEIDATCVGVSKYAYFFLQDELSESIEDQIKALIEAFDKDYETIQKYFGTANDTDGNGKVSFLIADLPTNIFGFFYTADKYSQSRLASGYQSNEADVLYINYNYITKNNWEAYETYLKATLTHEYQHMVAFDYRTNKGFFSTSLDTWLNEGLSMLAAYYCGYTTTHYNYITSYFLLYQGISLITNASNLDYGLSYLFARYLQIRFGDEYIKKVYDSEYTGIRAIEEATDMDFNELFSDFVKMILVTGRGVTEDERYNIKEFNYEEGTAGYEANGFNLASLIDLVYDYVYKGYYSSYVSNPNMFNATTGYTSPTINQYGFIITKWNRHIDSITISSQSEGVAGIYSAW